jgi:hypothetical protein
MRALAVQRTTPPLKVLHWEMWMLPVRVFNGNVKDIRVIVTRLKDHAYTIARVLATLPQRQA